MADARIEEIKTLLPRGMIQDWVRLGTRLVRLLRDRRHPTQHDALLDRLLEQARASVALRRARQAHVPRLNYPPDLPIRACKDEIVAAIRAHQIVVIAGETGSGKTTQIPKMCLEAGLGLEAKIGCTQPRRVAALSISRRLAEELNVAWGREVGCKIRFDDRSSPETYIKLMTDGILLAETQGDPTLSEYNALIIDEAHERSLNIDFLLGYLKGLLARRPDLKLIITSATIDTQAFSRHFDQAPIIEVSGRMYPVEILYRPLDAESEERGEISYVDAAVQAAENILYETNAGDLLVFMPSERDIRETSDQLEGRFAQEAAVIPLFGRLSAGDQQRVFAPSPRRKIVVATNIAETSLTIPGIRYVIDTGLARLSRYNPRTRTRRLPIEPISQSSANQRAGRAGRVEAGVCVRLFAEEDFQARSAFTQPEIQRSNLAEVILRMKAFGLGEIETFAFVQPPSPSAIATGYALLQELGALDERRELTPLGRDLAHLPIDPTLGRMLLQSQHEHATQELLVIASGLSIQDPRERPLDQKDAAAAAHRRFDDPRSDFLALLNIWNAVHDEWERLRTQTQRRRFCRQHFLSYLRMREWQDLYAQLHDALDDLGTLKLNESTAAYDAIHRSILAGLIGHVAHREERNCYRASGQRKVFVFPGSVFHERGESHKKKGPASPPTAQQRTSQPEWIVAGELTETSQLFARTIAGIDPLWIPQLAPHCCKTSHHHPHWSASSGRVLVEEVITFNGLEVRRRKAAYGNINPKDATAIFIRSALVEEDLLPPVQVPGHAGAAPAESRTPLPKAQRRERLLSSADVAEPELPPQYQFLIHNRAVRQKIENWQTRVRHHGHLDLDETLCAFYARHIEGISSIHELNRLLRDRSDPHFLCITEAELAGGLELNYDARAFPDAVPVGGQPVAIAYAYAPGEEHDGVTVKMPFTLAQSISPALLEWAVPGLREEKIGTLLRALPKALRRELMPFPAKVAEIVRDFLPTGQSFLHDLARFIHQRYGVEIPVSAWPTDALPLHLRPRIEVVGHDRKTLATGRDLDQLRIALKPAKREPDLEPPAWRRAAQRWERFDVTSWIFGDLPERITVVEASAVPQEPMESETPGGGLPLYGWPGLQVEDGIVHVRLFHARDAAREASLAGVRRLVEIGLQKDLGWIEKDLRGLSRFDALYAPMGSGDELRETALENLKRHLLPAAPLSALTEVQFRLALDEARRRLPGLASKMIDRLGALLPLPQQIRNRLHTAGSAPPTRLKTLSGLGQPGPNTIARVPHPLEAELAGLVGPRFLERIPFEKLPEIPRYLKALLIRTERAALNPLKDQERARLLAPYLQSLRDLQAQKKTAPEIHRAVDEFRWMVEEFKVSLFAQELGTSAPISAKRLDQYLEGLRRAGG